MKQTVRDMFGLAVVGVAAILSFGCDSGDEAVQRYHLSGTVTYGGKPVPSGRVDFLPDSSQGNSGPAGFAEIVNGAYSTSETGKGTAGGPYIAVISGTSSEPSKQTVSDEEFVANPPPSNSLFRDYRTPVNLPQETSIQNFDVPASNLSDR